MTLPIPPANVLPHHKLIAYQLALEFGAEGAARQTLADKARAYAIALAECCAPRRSRGPEDTSRSEDRRSACAAVEIAGALGARSPADVRVVVALGVRLKNVLSRLVH